MVKKTSNVGSNAGKVAGVVGLAAGIAAAAGYYFYGKDGKGHRKVAAAWTLKAKEEILKKIEQAKDISKPTYHKVVDEVMAKYKLVKNIDPKELQSFARDLKAHWADISKEAAKLTKKASQK